MAECGLLNLASCLPEKIFDFVLVLVNAPLQPLLLLVRNLLSEPTNLYLFVSIWTIIVYIISMFYAFLMIYSGLMFIVSGYDSAKRERAKTWLRNVIIMIILIQSSFFIYELAIELSSVMTTTVLSLIDDTFFLLTIDNIMNVGLQFLLGGLYAITLLLTSVILVFRYAFVAIGVVLFPIGIFFYFLPPLEEYGTLIMHFLGVCIFIPFFDAVILLGFSQLLDVTIFQNIKILIMISAFLMISVFMFVFLLLAIVKAGFSAYNKFGSLAKKLG